MITSVHRAAITAWPSGWEDVEVVDSVLVEEPTAPEPTAPEPPSPAPAGYSRFGRVAKAERYGHLVSVLA